MKQVKFIKKHPPYNAGETAGFTPEAAADLERTGFVKIIGDAKLRKKPEAAQTPATAASTS